MVVHAQQLVPGVGRNNVFGVTGAVGVARSNLLGLGSRLRCLGARNHASVTRGVGMTHKCNSLSRGDRCSRTGGRRTGVRTHVIRVRTVLGGMRIVRRIGNEKGPGAMSLNIGMLTLSVRFSRRYRCHIINSLSTSPVSNGVSSSSPLNGTLLNGGINSRIVISTPTNRLGFGVLRVLGWCSVCSLGKHSGGKAGWGNWSAT